MVNIGSNITGSVTAATIGFLIGGPPGAVAGAVVGPGITSAIKKIGEEISNRVLGVREKERIGPTLIYAVEKIKENQNKGKEIREDNFFKGDKGRSTAEEITEGILLNAQKEYQEKKLKFHGNLLANIAFTKEISREEANYMIRLSEKLTYGQLCVIALFARSEKYNLRNKSWRGSKDEITSDKAAVLQEIFELYSQGLLNGGGEALLGVGDIIPNKMKIQGITSSLHNLMELWTIEVKDIVTLLE